MHPVIDSRRTWSGKLRCIMKTTHPLSIVLISLFSLPAIGQSKEEEIVFEYAVDLFQREKYQDAADSFGRFLEDFPDSPLKGRAHYNLALSFKELEDRTRAKAIFREILAMPYNERDGNSLMEPYTLYKHHSCRMLALIALDEQSYKEAEHYIKMFDKKFPYQHFCGNEWAAYKMFKAVMIARVYSGTDQPQKAIETLVPYTFSNALASNQEVLEVLEATVRREFTKDEIKAELIRAVESLQVIQANDRTTAAMMLFNVKVEVEDFYMDKEANESDLERYRRIVRSNEFFKKYLR